MTLFQQVAGDVKATEVVGLEGIADITGATVEAHVWSGTTAANLTGAVTTAVATATDPCSVTIQYGATAGQVWLPTITATSVWSFEVELTFPDGTVATWPRDGPPDTLQIRAQGDPP